MISGIAKFGSEQEKKEYVEKCERDFEDRLDIAAAKLLCDESVNLYTLSGPTCSGKTPTAKKLINEFSARGKNVHIISIDNFYLDRKILNARAAASDGKIDYDSVLTLDYILLKDSIEEILAHGVVELPRYDFTTGSRVGYDVIDITEDDTFVFEGIQAMYPEIVKLFEGRAYRSVVAYIGQELTVGESTFTKNEIRLFRRIVRDFKFRNATPEFTFELWESVRRNEEINIYPYVSGADVLVSSLLPCEINILKPELETLLPTINKTNKYHRYAENMLERLAGIEEISGSYLSVDSMYREFIG